MTNIKSTRSNSLMMINDRQAKYSKSFEHTTIRTKRNKGIRIAVRTPKNVPKCE